MKEILITGSTGFIGHNLVLKLSKQNKIYGISRKKRKSFDNFISIKNDLNKSKNFTIQKKISKIIHTAALTNTDNCNQRPMKCFENNVNGTLKMLEFARKNDSKFIFLSSSHVYGNTSKVPFSENAISHPLTHYGMSKKISEMLCETYSKSYGLDIQVARIFSAYGPEISKSNIIFRIINQIQNNSRILVGNIFPKRDFIFISDLINALIHIINSKRKGYHIYNVGSGKSFSIEQVIETCLDISGKNLKIILDKNKIRENDIPDVRANISKIKSEFDWKPEISLKKGLEITYNYYN